jgi:hypothetical protein
LGGEAVRGGGEEYIRRLHRHGLARQMVHTSFWYLGRAASHCRRAGTSAAAMAKHAVRSAGKWATARWMSTHLPGSAAGGLQG